jgi:antagonist of KipI
MSLEVLEPGFMTTVQDVPGRRGYAKLGVPRSGAMDWFALMAANYLVGNDWDAAGLECFSSGPILCADAGGVVAAAGRGFELSVEDEHFPLWTAVPFRRGQRIQLKPQPDAAWGYLAFAGGVDVPRMMGSYATCLRAEFGGYDGRTLQVGDVLKIGGDIDQASTQPGRHSNLPAAVLPGYGERVTIRVIPGPQADYFKSDGWRAFLTGEYTISALSDRMGYRLEGRLIPFVGNADVLSEGTIPGTIQVPGDGQPVVLMADSQTTGGYAKIATVITADLPLLAQCPPGRGKMCFQETTVVAAQECYRGLLNRLQQALMDDHF